MREDTWMPHELVLVLDMYLRLGDLQRRAPEVVEASAALRRIALADGNRPDNFRSPSSVAAKLANFKSLDARVSGGRPNAGDNDRLVWRRFSENPAAREVVAAGVWQLAEALK